MSASVTTVTRMGSKESALSGGAAVMVADMGRWIVLRRWGGEGRGGKDERGPVGEEHEGLIRQGFAGLAAREEVEQDEAPECVPKGISRPCGQILEETSWHRKKEKRQATCAAWRI